MGKILFKDCIVMRRLKKAKKILKIKLKKRWKDRILSDLKSIKIVEEYMKVISVQIELEKKIIE